MPTTFAKLSEGWNAEPNAPHERVSRDGRDVLLSFHLNPYQYPSFHVGDKGTIRFSECWRYRLGSTNDEGWYRGQCRFSGVAPAWGEFYEVRGDLRLTELTESWVILGEQSSETKHYLFYFRDTTFECDATGWQLTVSKGHDA